MKTPQTVETYNIFIEKKYKILDNIYIGNIYIENIYIENIYIIIQNRGSSEPFLEGGAAGLHNEDYFFSHEISLKFPNHQKFCAAGEISSSKMWRECA